MSSPERVLSGDDLRVFMRRVASPVVVITAHHNGMHKGATIGSFNSVSLNPPLVSFNVGVGSAIQQILQEAQYYAVHLIAPERMDLLDRFAVPGYSQAQQFEGLEVIQDSSGTPYIGGMPGVLICRIEERYPAGDHQIILGAPEKLLLSEPAEGVVFFASAYHAVGSSGISSSAP